MLLNSHVRSFVSRQRAGVAGWQRQRRAAATIAAGVRLQSVTRRFGETVAVQDVTLEVAAGEIVCLLGPSGCGKTTLLRLIAGLEAPDSGQIFIDEREVSGPSRQVPPEKRGVGLMFQDFALFPHLKVVDNVAFGLQGMGRAKALAEAHAALERMGLARYADDYPHVLSGGQQQRVALARAIVPRPQIMLMDEPFSGLDPRLRSRMREETLDILRETRATCVIVTHEAEEAMRMGDRIAVMREGRLVQTGAPEEIYRKPADLFIAEMFSEINVVPCHIAGGAAYSPLGTFAANGQAEGAGMLCFRPQVVKLTDTGDGTPGRIIELRFLGNDTLVEIAVDGVDVPLLMRTRGRLRYAAGAEVGVTVDPEKLMIFSPAESAGEGGA